MSVGGTGSSPLDPVPVGSPKILDDLPGMAGERLVVDFDIGQESGSLLVHRGVGLASPLGIVDMERRKNEILNSEDVLNLLRSEIAKAGSQRRWAKENGISRPIVCRALVGYGQLQPKLLKALGLKKIDTYTWR